MPTFVAIFYASLSPVDLTVRIFSRNPEQPFGQVPDHVGFGIEESDIYWEALPPRVRAGTLKNALAQKDICRVIRIPITSAQAHNLVQWITPIVNAKTKYGWRSTWINALCFIAPCLSRCWMKSFPNASLYDCSYLFDLAAKQIGVFLQERNHSKTPNEAEDDILSWIAARSTQ